MENIKFIDQNLEKGLYLVSTPIGNLADITIRALNILKKSDVILCEDKRVSKKLLDYYDIKAELFSYHKFNEKKSVEKILELFKKKKIVSLISDAGTPLISDPGRILINEIEKNNIKIIPIPGASAVTAAFSLAGYSDDYYFYGFLPKKSGERRKVYEKFSNLDSSVVIFLPTRDLVSIIKEMKEFLGERKILIGKEITKIHENIIKGTFDDILDKIKSVILKGEVTIVLSSETNKNKEQDIDLNKEILDLSTKMKTADLAKYLSKKFKFSKQEIYKKILMLGKK
ncbi:MAG: 16S rRNA (cytidine(1402)-2'-O)-methyltransferase [Candidatus Fonsibacter sp.]|nr:16S rRNA (cytidine(1402)-2'-O)-methyltransferase [Candidatus Fonsibacter sp.]